MSMELNKALELLREIRPSIPKEVLELWCKDRDAFLASHPAVEQAGGDERAAFEQWLEQHMSHHFSPELDLAKYEDSGEYRYNPAADYWKAWQARAALAQPSPKCVKCGGTGEADSGGVHPWGEPVLIPCDCETEQEEAERPEVVARVVHSNPVVLGQCGPLNANDELMTVAQHAASVARWAEMFNRVEQERDAALARVAELEGKLTDWVHEGFRLNEALAVAKAQHSVPDDDMILQIFADNAEHSEQGDEHGYCIVREQHAQAIARKLLAAAPGNSAQHSVPEEFIGRLSEFLAQRGATGTALLRELRDMLAAAPGKEVGHE